MDALQMHTCICGEHIETPSYYACDHFVCPSCALRLRVFQNISCPYCRKDSEVVTVCKSFSSRRNDTSQFLELGRAGIYCETEKIKAKLLNILNYPCAKCGKTLYSMKGLKEHVTTIHHLTMCSVCTRQEAKFSSEYTFFTNKSLLHHIRQSHPLCVFCKKNFYSNEELSQHCRQHHQVCFVCERSDPEHPQYFSTYEKLEYHFQENHYRCLVQTCLDDKFVVFESRLELLQHMADVHRDRVGIQSIDTIDISELNLGAPSRIGGLRSNVVEPQLEEGNEFSTSEMAHKRYMARIKIFTRGDKKKLEDIETASKTFREKYVPILAMISIYRNILDVTEEEAVVLISEFAKFSHMPADSQKALSLFLATRSADGHQLQVNSANRKATKNSRDMASNMKASAVIRQGRSSNSLTRAGWATESPKKSTLSTTSRTLSSMSNLPRLSDLQSHAQPNLTALTPKIRLIKTLPQQKPRSESPAFNKTFSLKTPGPQTRLPALTTRMQRGPTQSTHDTSSVVRIGVERFNSSQQSKKTLSSASNSPNNFRLSQVQLPVLEVKEKRKPAKARVLKLV